MGDSGVSVGGLGVSLRSVAVGVCLGRRVVVLVAVRVAVGVGVSGQIHSGEVGVGVAVG